MKRKFFIVFWVKRETWEGNLLYSFGQRLMESSYEWGLWLLSITLKIFIIQQEKWMHVRYAVKEWKSCIKSTRQGFSGVMQLNHIPMRLLQALARTEVRAEWPGNCQSKSHSTSWAQQAKAGGFMVFLFPSNWCAKIVVPIILKFS